MNSGGRLFGVRDRFVALCVVVKRVEDPQVLDLLLGKVGVVFMRVH
jgi:hypothetical protein